MTVKRRRTTHLYYFVLLVIITLWSCIAAQPVSTTPNTIVANTAPSNRDLTIDISFKRQLRTHLLEDSHDVSPEERTGNTNLSGISGLKGLITSGTKKMKELGEKTKLMLTSNNQQATDRLFNRLQVGTSKSKLFESEPYQKWSASVFKAYKSREAAEVAIFTTLATHYGDEVSAKLLAEAQQLSRTKAIAKQLESVQLDNWMKSGKTSDEIYSLLKLKTEDGNLLKNPLLNTWISYVDKLKEENPYQLLLRKLTRIYNDDDLARLLVTSEHDDNTRIIATKLKTTRFESWSNDRKSPDDIFKLLRLKTEEADDMLKSPKLRIWFEYVRSLKKNPEELLFSELKTRYTDEGLVTVIFAAKGDPNTRMYASGLTATLLSNWLRTDRSVDDAFKLLQLNKVEGEKLFNSPGWSTWVSYATKVNENNADEMMFSVLKKHYSGEGLVNIIAKAKEDINTKDIASKLQENMWWNQGKSTDDVFNLLHLDKAGDDLFERPEFVIWFSYANKLSNKKSDEFTAISDLEGRFGNVVLALMLDKAILQAKSSKATTVLKSLQELQFKQWMTEKFMDPGVVSRMMSIHMKEPRSTSVIVKFRDFYKANGGSPFY